MQYLAPATDYDGTLATDGVVDSITLDALRRWKASGRKLILITGRRMDDFLSVFSHMDLFDLVVVENGAVLYFPETGAERLLAEPPHPEFVSQLSDRILQSTPEGQIPPEFQTLVKQQNLKMLAVGRIIVATWVPHVATVQELIEVLSLDHLQIIRNKGAVMILPEGIDKAHGLNAALEEIGIPHAATVGVGDAENDAVFLELCGFSVAVSNALDDLKAQVHWVTATTRGAGVAELIDRLLVEDR
ncbi:MAG: HAD family phosphatase [Synechococcales cyanobacterium T60_A2020_003]|nr:HAD family phosphatase [Synechococcales cyanobacterium T60_A2020_003]